MESSALDSVAVHINYLQLGNQREVEYDVPHYLYGFGLWNLLVQISCPYLTETILSVTGSANLPVRTAQAAQFTLPPEK